MAAEPFQDVEPRTPTEKECARTEDELVAALSAYFSASRADIEADGEDADTSFRWALKRTLHLSMEHALTILLTTLKIRQPTGLPMPESDILDAFRIVVRDVGEGVLQDISSHIATVEQAVQNMRDN